MTYILSVLRKPLISLARMILWPKYYTASDEDDESKDFPMHEESAAELAAAQTIMRFILRHNEVHVNTLKPTSIQEGQWLAGDQSLAWQDPGEETMTIPDLRHLFMAFKEFALDKEDNENGNEDKDEAQDEEEKEDSSDDDTQSDLTVMSS